MPMLLILALAASPAVVSMTTHSPERSGQCFRTAVKSVETRLVDGDGPTAKPVPGSGSSMTFTDGHSVVAYDQIPALDRSTPGDPVRLCVVGTPRRCPKGDTRGIGYSVRNLRTGGFVGRIFDSEHLCGGA